MAEGIAGWDDLHHSGLLLDSVRLAALAHEWPLAPLHQHVAHELRRRAATLPGGLAGDEANPAAAAFVAFVLEQVCGFDAATGTWARGSNVAPAYGRRAVTGEVMKPRQLWKGLRGARLPVFFDRGANLGMGKSRRAVSQVLGWLRAGDEQLALVTNGRQLRLVFAGMDFDASCQWDAGLWFEEGELAPQVTALRSLLRPELWTPPKTEGNEAPPLLQAIRNTRKGQAELSEVLGERVREAVELLIQSHGEALQARCANVPPADIYRAACRVVMRLVIVLFAESRDLLPRDNALYRLSYGLGGLFERLQREAVRGSTLAESLSAWPRVLALFRLVHEGSHFPDLPVPAYGGELFAPATQEDGLSRALAVFESACFEGAGCCSDGDVHSILKLLTRTTVRIRQGRGSVAVAAPVDFSDLSSEYIGIVYEGVLDYELKIAQAGDPVIFLAVGDQPALPLSRLEAMPDSALERLFENLKKPSDTAADSLAEGDELADDDALTETDIRQRNRTRAENWARRAAQVAGLVPNRRHAEFEQQLAATAKRLVARVVLPGEWYLVRWGGTRKGSGTFHTRPGLAVPTVQRTLRPLAFDPPLGKDGTPNVDAPAAHWTPKLPEEILNLKVADHREFEGSPAWQRLKAAMDLWCACWFWPPNELDCAPLPRTFTAPSAATLTVAKRLAEALRFFHWELEFPDVFDAPGAGFDALLGNPPWDIAKPVSKEFFSNIDPLYRSYGKQEALRKQTEYFKNEEGAEAGWQAEENWLDYNARFRAQSNFTSHAASPFGDPTENAASQSRFAVTRGKDNHVLHDNWRRERARGQRRFADPAHPFRHQGSADLNLYKLFLEAGYALLKFGGRLGFVVPSGLYSDNGTGPLRRLFLEHCRWEWLFGIENRDRVFPIHRSYKFNPVIVQKGGTTEAIRTAFMRRNLDDWEHAEALATPYTRAQVTRFSPKSRAILEIQSARDLEILEKIYKDSVLLGDDGPKGWGIRYTREFDMTNDSRLFPPRPQWEAKGYRPDEYSRWLLGDWRPIGELWAELGVDPSRPEPVGVALEEWLFDASAGPERRMAEARFAHGHLLKPGDVAQTQWRVRCAQPPYDRLPVARANIPAGVVLSREGDAWIREDRVWDVALPLYEGRMIGQFDSSQKGWISGKGRGSVWRDIPWEHKQVEPQYLMAASVYRDETERAYVPKVLHMRVGSATNTRTAIASFACGVPSGDTAASFYAPQLEDNLVLTAVLNSLAFDFVTRARLTGLHLDYHVWEQNPLPAVPRTLRPVLAAVAFRLIADSKTVASQGLRLAAGFATGIADAERRRLAVVLDAVVAVLYGLARQDLVRVIEDCDDPPESTSRSDAKGFWRVDKDRTPNCAKRS